MPDHLHMIAGSWGGWEEVVVEEGIKEETSEQISQGLGLSRLEQS